MLAALTIGKFLPKWHRELEAAVEAMDFPHDTRNPWFV